MGVVWGGKRGLRSAKERAGGSAGTERTRTDTRWTRRAAGTHVYTVRICGLYGGGRPDLVRRAGNRTRQRSRVRDLDGYAGFGPRRLRRLPQLRHRATASAVPGPPLPVPRRRLRHHPSSQVWTRQAAGPPRGRRRRQSRPRRPPGQPTPPSCPACATATTKPSPSRSPSTCPGPGTRATTPS